MARSSRSTIGRDVRRMVRKVKRLGRDVQNDVAHRVVETAALDVEREAESRAPVDDGDLRESIQTHVGLLGPKGGGLTTPAPGVAARVVMTDVDHAGHVEFGTEQASAKPYMRPTYDTQAPRILSQMGKAAVDEIERRARR